MAMYDAELLTLLYLKLESMNENEKAEYLGRLINDVEATYSETKKLAVERRIDFYSASIMIMEKRKFGSSAAFG